VHVQGDSRDHRPVVLVRVVEIGAGARGDLVVGQLVGEHLT
jgi:hypothetical protein